MRIIKIYRHYNGETNMVAECMIILSTKIVYYRYDERNVPVGCVINSRAKIVKCKLAPSIGLMADDVREVIEANVQDRFSVGGLEGILRDYKPPVGGPIVQINNVDYSWTIEEGPLEEESSVGEA